MGSGSKSTALQSLAPTIGMQSNLDQSTLDMIQKSPPEKLNVSLSEYNKLLNDYAYLNANQNKAAEMEINPAIAKARLLNENDLYDTYKGAVDGKLPVGVQNALMSAGLERQAGTGTATGDGTRGNATLTELYGRGTNDYINQIRSMMTNYLSGRPTPVAGLDPASAASLKLNTNITNLDQENQFRQNLVNATIGANTNLANRGTAFGNAAAVQANQNVASGNQGAASTLGTITSIIGAAAVAY